GGGGPGAVARGARDEQQRRHGADGDEEQCDAECALRGARRELNAREHRRPGAPEEAERYEAREGDGGATAHPSRAGAPARATRGRDATPPSPSATAGRPPRPPCPGGPPARRG